jgi:hypothetical protein
MSKLFTKSCFALCTIDQGKVLDAALAEVESAAYISKEDERKAHQKAQRIRRKASTYGLMVRNTTRHKVSSGPEAE